jgi:predicted hydrocarbon binding protein
MQDNFIQVDVFNYLTNNYKEVDFLVAIKVASVKAVKGKLGESVETVLQNGLRETINVVKQDANSNVDVIITNMGEEKYVISYKKFIKNYKKVKENIYKPKTNYKVVLKLKDDISFVAPWKELMHISRGGFLVINNQDDIYGINESEFSSTYKIVKN